MHGDGRLISSFFAIIKIFFGMMGFGLLVVDFGMHFSYCFWGWELFGVFFICISLPLWFLVGGRQILSWQEGWCVYNFWDLDFLSWSHQLVCFGLSFGCLVVSWLPSCGCSIWVLWLYVACVIWYPNVPISLILALSFKKWFWDLPKLFGPPWLLPCFCWGLGHLWKLFLPLSLWVHALLDSK